MKKIFLSVAFGLLLSSGLYAQNTESRVDSTVVESNDKYRVVTNRFSGNWFIGAGAGAQVFFGDHDKQMQFKDRLTPAFEFYVGKWFTPGIGVRVAANGIKAKGLTHNGLGLSHSTGEIYQDVKNKGDLGILEVQEFNYYNVHGDVMFNLSNMFGGYNPDRFYSVSPYLGVGWMSVWEKPKSREVSANLGIYNAFRLSNAFNLTLDVRGSMVKDRFDGEEGRRKEEGMLTAALGVAYNFKKRTWDREKIVHVTTYDERELNALRDKVNALANDNESLLKQLADAKNNSITDVKVDKKVLVAPILVTFPINKSVVSNEARVNLGFFAKVINEGGSNVVYNVSGYADKGTGSIKTNERLAKERAEAIYNVLVREFGVNPSQLTTSHHGGVDNMYYNDPRLSRAVIVIGQ